jgi:hypothetical protein
MSDQKRKEPSPEAWRLLYSYMLRTTVPRLLEKRKQEQAKEQSA